MAVQAAHEEITGAPVVLAYIDLPQMAAAYKLQVRSDFGFLAKLLNDTGVNPCHKAHAFQMCIEKFAKYHQLKSGRQISKQHNWAIKVIPHLFERTYRNRYPKNSLRNVIPVVRDFCRELDLLAPAHYGADRQNPVNCEYPWEVTASDGSNPRAFAPCAHRFRVFDNRYMQVTKKILTMIHDETR